MTRLETIIEHLVGLRVELKRLSAEQPTKFPYAGAIHRWDMMLEGLQFWAMHWEARENRDPQEHQAERSDTEA